MAEIDIDRAGWAVLFNGQLVADVRKDVPPSILEAFFVLAEGRTSEADAERIEELEEEVEELERTIHAIKDILSND